MGELHRCLYPEEPKVDCRLCGSLWDCVDVGRMTDRQVSMKVHANP